MKLSIAGKYRTLVAVLEGDIDHHSAENLRERIDREFSRTGAVNIAFDFSHVSFMDSSGIAIVINSLRFMNKTEGMLELIGLQSQPMKVLRASGIEKLVKIQEVIK